MQDETRAIRMPLLADLPEAEKHWSNRFQGLCLSGGLCIQHVVSRQRWQLVGEAIVDAGGTETSVALLAMW